jgi:hypothetical protein
VAIHAWPNVHKKRERVATVTLPYQFPATPPRPGSWNQATPAPLPYRCRRPKSTHACPRLHRERTETSKAVTLLMPPPRTQSRSPEVTLPCPPGLQLQVPNIPSKLPYRANCWLPCSRHSRHSTPNATCHPTLPTLVTIFPANTSPQLPYRPDPRRPTPAPSTNLPKMHASPLHRQPTVTPS